MHARSHASLLLNCWLGQCATIVQDAICVHHYEAWRPTNTCIYAGAAYEALEVRSI